MNLDTEGMRTNILAVGDVIVGTTFDGASHHTYLDTITDLGPPEPAADDVSTIRFIAATRRWPDLHDRVQNQGVFYWAPIDHVHQVRIIYSGEPGVSALI